MKSSLTTHQLVDFLLAANAAGYATGEEKSWTKNQDGSTTISFQKDDWSMNDTFYGGEPYGGRLVVFYKNKPHWIMVYYGWVDASIPDPNPIYTVLRSALQKMPSDAPFRGPSLLQEGTYVYNNSWVGTVQQYSGTETIQKDKKTVYEAHYMGGFVDQRQGT